MSKFIKPESVNVSYDKLLWYSFIHFATGKPLMLSTQERNCGFIHKLSRNGYNEPLVGAWILRAKKEAMWRALSPVSFQNIQDLCFQDCSMLQSRIVEELNDSLHTSLWTSDDTFISFFYVRNLAWKCCGSELVIWFFLRKQLDCWRESLVVD